MDQPKESFPTPKLGTIDFQKVYEPSEDTFLLLDALESDIEELKRAAPYLIVEVGSGSGCVVTFLSKLLHSITGHCVYSIATDINPHAMQATRCTAMHNLVSVDPVMTSMCEGMRLEGLVDVLIFNPPYVPSELDEVVIPSPRRIRSDNIVDAAFAGGPDGRYWVDLFFPHVPRLLSPQGTFWLVTIEHNKPQELMTLAHEQYGLKSRIVKRRKAGMELLYILKFWK
jgi:release factor glutamine methyltransferase